MPDYIRQVSNHVSHQNPMLKSSFLLVSESTTDAKAVDQRSTHSMRYEYNCYFNILALKINVFEYKTKLHKTFYISNWSRNSAGPLDS